MKTKSEIYTGPFWGWRCTVTNCYITTKPGHYLPAPWKRVSTQVFA